MIRLAIILIFNIIISLNFEIMNHSAKAIIDNIELEQPFLGGVNYPRNQWLDIDGDNINELFILDEDGCIRLYRYILNDDLSSSFFEILDTAYGNLCGMNWFSLYDINNDNQVDLLCQSLDSNNQVQLYHMVNNQFILVGTIVDNNNNPIISDASMVPTFADIDSDGDLDFFTGNTIGTVTYYENIQIVDSIPIFELISFEWQDIWIVGPSRDARHGASAINFIDIDSDGDLDLSWGDYFQRGLYLIYNIGSPDSPIMDTENIISNFPYNDPIYTAGRNMPSFNDIDLDGDMDLFISVLGGDGGIQLSKNFLFYENINGVFQLVSDDFMNTIDLNSDIAPQMVDIDSDGDLDLFIGQDYNTSTFPIRGRIYFFRNIGDQQDIFELENDEFLGTDIGNSLVPVFTDIDSDSDLDLFVGNYNGTILFYRNVGSGNSINFIYESNLSDINLQSYSSPAFVDIDSDGDLDLFAGDNSGKIYFYQNNGSNMVFDFELISDNFLNIDVGSRSAPTFEDIDLDGDMDMIIGSENQNVKIFINSGNIYSSNYNEYSCIDIPHYGMNSKIDFYTKNDTIYNIIGLSTGGLLHSKFNNNLGDVNLDNSIDIEDILVVVSYIINSSENINFCYSDINFDQYIDLLDIILLVYKILN